LSFGFWVEAGYARGVLVFSVSADSGRLPDASFQWTATRHFF